ncbi:MAG: succinate dehydrogenase cytochrome b subunit [Verrucomicrobiota bacterium]|nr:succinate dehydrogenase cytochrome b subunit [Verrucomicrobiota bacterium]
MNTLKPFFASSLGKKYVMAVTGILLFGFVVMHLLGNLQVFMGSEQINDYGHFLKSKPLLVWGARLGLLVVVLLHIWSAIRLTAENKAARPIGYGEYKAVGASYASRTMFMSGLIIAAFIVYHLLHYTALVPAVNLTGKDFGQLLDSKGHPDVYRMIVLGFSQVIVSVFYLIAMALLCLHLSHGLQSMFQSLGWKNRKYSGLISNFARLFSIVIFLGYASIPLAVLFGVLK